MFCIMGTWCWYILKSDCCLRDLRFISLHQAPQYLDDTAMLIHNQWPGPLTENGEAEPNYIRTSGLKESGEQFPSHLIAVFQDRVVAHCVLRSLPQKRSLSKFMRMLKAGVPFDAVKQAVEFAGVDPCVLDQMDIEDKHTHHNKEDQVLEVTVASLVVTPELRGRGLGKAMCGFAARWAYNHGNVERVVFSCSDTLIGFYKKLGCKKKTAKQRPGIPKVRLGNEMYIEIDQELLHKADEIIEKFSH